MIGLYLLYAFGMISTVVVAVLGFQENFYCGIFCSLMVVVAGFCTWQVHKGVKKGIAQFS